MVGALRVRSIIHAMETLMEEVDSGEKSFNAVLGDIVHYYGVTKLMLEALAVGDYTWSPDTEKEVAPIINVEAEQGTALSLIKMKKSVKVNADLMDRLVLESDEVFLEKTMLLGSLQASRRVIKALEDNVKYLISLARELELHTETQMQSNHVLHQQENDDNFDPLEFDRFTRLHELSRSINEHVNDSFDLQQSLSKLGYQQEEMLEQQDISISDVRSNLMKTRLIPFSTISSRLRKIVEQTSKEVNKTVKIFINGGDITIDSAILEKVVSPIEHAIRNSLAHGIESAERRAEIKKDPVGSITVTLSSKGGKMVIEIKDDGGGIAVSRVCEKAISKGMWKEGVPMSPDDAAELICMAGFSTADSVSQVAGRGVGMDVVKSEIQSLGGHFVLKSKTNEGLKVLFFLPSSVSSSSALLVESMQEQIFIPTDNIEDVLLLNKEQVSIARENKTIAYGKEQIAIPYHRLSDVYHLESSREDSDQALSDFYRAVVMSDEEKGLFVIEVDKVLGEQSISVKPLKNALSLMPGVSGTSILSSGTPAFVVNPVLTLKDNKHRFAINNIQDVDLMITKKKTSVIMVVDDSITVRKITSRFLLKNNFECILAKDGLDAIEKLTQLTPDVILLDVEMPRMDGFEFAKHIKGTEKFRDIPVIMITSRTASKHRDHAMGLGVSEYIGKPYKEEFLLELINKYTE